MESTCFNTQKENDEKNAISASGFKCRARNSRLSRDLKEIRKGSSQEEKKKKNRASLSLFTWYRAKFSKPDAGLESEEKRKK